MNDQARLTAKLVPFYLGEQPDSEGRTIADIWDWDFETLEEVHDYIQWLFPLPESSAFNPDAPLVTAEVIQAFQSNPQLRDNLRRSLSVMLRFYGLQDQTIDSSQKPHKIAITRSEDYANREPEWVHPFNHNYLRITRILKCLMVFGLAEEARAFYACLRQIYQERSDQIGDRTFQYWTNAVR